MSLENMSLERESLERVSLENMSLERVSLENVSLKNVPLKKYPLQANILIDRSHVAAPSTLQTWHQTSLDFGPSGTHFGYVYEGSPRLSCASHDHEYGLQPGMFFAMPGEGTLLGEQSSGVVITHPGRRVFTLGGPMETTGRLAYINGGTTNVLIPPMMVGDPCLNALYFPPNVDQTLHTHPSDRLGMVVAGEGEFETPEAVMKAMPGDVFLIPEHTLHKFRTTTQNLTLVVFHPDSDVGFNHTMHPMLNRTLVDGVSATHLPEIHTHL